MWGKLIIICIVMFLMTSCANHQLLVIRWYFMFAVELTSGFELMGSHWWSSRHLVQGMILNSHVCLVYLLYL